MNAFKKDKPRDKLGKFVKDRKAGLLSNNKNSQKKNDTLLTIPGEKNLNKSPIFKNSKCTPTTFYLIFAGIQIFMDLINGVYYSAIVKFLIMIVFSTLLNILCMRNLGIVSWLLVFMPFILTTLVSALILDTMNSDGKTITTDYINFNIN